MIAIITGRRRGHFKANRSSATALTDQSWTGHLKKAYVFDRRPQRLALSIVRGRLHYLRGLGLCERNEHERHKEHQRSKEERATPHGAR